MIGRRTETGRLSSGATCVLRWGVCAFLVATLHAKEGQPETAKAEQKPAIKHPGLPNFHRVSDQLYRGAQPTEAGFRKLKEMGVRTVVNLRSFHSDRSEIGETGLAYEHIYMKAWHPEEKEIVRFLQIVTDKRRQPVFVHCLHGADRTGTMCAIYRVAVGGWSKDRAIAEMTQERYGFHKVWQNLIRFVKELDIKDIKTRAGIK